MAHLSLNQYQMHPHHYARHLPLYPVLFTHKSHDCPHFNIYISFGGSKYCILYNCTKYMSYITFTLYFTSFLLHLCKLCITIIAKIA
ncbi:ASG_G0027650.mRNA.1.CDS.1 [Saccharomyces cerevisiae]|nr:BLD_1a_G0027680.mRNA.1.CDS.1 [Saccharomyces cerevisiae]CAI4530726.1 ASG_G0027650.mRNA.1.CDS.1 [Saccharomyces cerevisiae]CAI4550914.1 AVB_G0028110.mRNA.1.CDS.1 [Saccharomyces cerevisiae]CAI7160623.1 BLD_1a_G0027680.mRNA.1.CDS.1 [Saccharomyces cerevisiae]CAI7161259.1 ASG_G0027650.mRNA.1.CDS.1 [Saccharomyces cerevisiae]